MKKILNEDYKKMVSQREKSPFVKNFILAFAVGGMICILGQIITNLFLAKGFDKELSVTFGSVSLIFLSCLLTAFGMFDKIAKHAGAGTLVPITGFANAILAPAMEFKSEGLILGIGSKMFVIAGPVIVYGVAVSSICGFIYYLLGGR